MDVRKRVAQNLRRLRVTQGVSQENLAVDADIDRTHVSRIERAIENPTILVLDRLAGALGVDVSELLARVRAGTAAPALLPKGRKKR
jgi:transcriptional regulator with XRE-family HTH domain